MIPMTVARVGKRRQGRPQLWRAEAEIQGRRFEAFSENDPTSELARMLLTAVKAGTLNPKIEDEQVAIEIEGRWGIESCRSLQTLAEFVYEPEEAYQHAGNAGR